MDDAKYEAQRERIVMLAKRWISAIGLGWWRITNSYDRTGEDFADSTTRAGGFRTGTAARCFPEWRYGFATIVWNMPEVAEMDDEVLENTFVHELMHIYLHELRGDEESDHLDHEEHAATSLAKAFIWIRDAAAEGTMGPQTGVEPTPEAPAGEAEDVPAYLAGSRSA